MTTFANTRELKVALLGVIRQASQPRVSRRAVAAELETIADKLGATTRRRKKAPAAPPPPPQVIRNIGAEEEKVLGWLETGIDSALEDVKREKSYAETNAEDLKREEEVTGEKADGNPWDPGKFFVGQITHYLSENLEWLARTLEEHAPVTQEDELARAVRDFSKKIPPEGRWPEDGDGKVYDAVAKALGEAKALVPKHLSKPSELGSLRKTFEAIAKAIKLMCGKNIQVPKIPNALDEEDPRQLGFRFSASRRIATTAELVQRLDGIWRMASEEHPSRRELAAALLSTAGGLRPTKVAVKVDEKGSGDWTVYFETENPKTIHRWKYRSKSEARQVAIAEQKKRGGFVTIMKGGIEQESIGPNSSD